MQRRWIFLAIAMLPQSPMADAQALFPPGESPSAKIAFMRQMNDQWGTPSRRLRDRYCLGALTDESAEVRAYAADCLVGDEYVPSLIQTLATDTDRRVRTLAAMSLSRWVTSNGSETCSSLTQVVQNLEQLLTGLSDEATQQYVVEVLGGRYSGEKPLVCCMPDGSKQQVVYALREHAGELPELTGPPRSGPEEALRNIAQCEL